MGEEIRHCLHGGKSSRTLHSSLDHTRIKTHIPRGSMFFFFLLPHINLKSTGVLVVHQCDSDLKLEASRIRLEYQKSLIQKSHNLIAFTYSCCSGAGGEEFGI